VLVFNTGSPIITNVPTQTIAELDLTGGAFVTLNAATIPSGDKTLTISGGNLSVAPGTSLTIAASTALAISVAAGSTGTISGQIILQDAAHRVQAADANGINFQSGSIFTTSIGFSGNPFGAGTDGSVVFASGASSFFNAGSDPFGGSGHSVATFNLGSSQTFNAATAFSSDGRTYGNLTLDGSQSYSGSGTNTLTIFNSLTIAPGSTLALSSSSGGDLNLLGDITINGAFDANGRTVRFQGGGLSGTTQNINTTATFGDVIISKIAGSVKLGGTLTVNGALQFNGTSSAEDVIDLNANILNLNGSIGGTSTSTTTGFKGDLTGATINIGGTGALGILRFVNFVSGAQALKSLTVNRTSSGSVTLGSNLTIGDASSGSLTLTNGVIDAGSNTISLASFPSITRTNGYIIGNLQKSFGATGSFSFTVGTANGYSPVDANVTSGGGGFLAVKAVQGKQPAISDGTTALQRYWTLSSSGITADLTFHYLGTDVMGTEANYKFFKYLSGNFTQFTPNALNTGTHTAQLLGVSVPPFSDWILAQGWQVQFSASNYTTMEGDSGSHAVTITVQRVGGTTGTASVHWATSDGTATAGSDYVAASGDLNWTPGDGTDKTFTVTVNGDTVYDASETVNLTLSGATGGLIGGTNPVILTILNDDLPPATLTVNTTDDVDSGFCLASHCSLREAINAANVSSDPNTINFDPTVFAAPGPYTITLTSGELLIDKNLTIQGPGADVLTISGNDASRVFKVMASGTVSFSGLTISHGMVRGDFGGGIYNNSAIVNISNSTLRNNFAGSGGAIFNGTNGRVSLSNASVINNSALSAGGGVSNASYAMLNVTNSTISGNSTQHGRGGGIYIVGGGAVNITNSTISNNTANFGSGGGIADNNSTAPVLIRNSIIALNTAQTGPDLNGVFGSQGHNLVGRLDSAAGFFIGMFDDIVGFGAAPINPLLAPLGNFGGPTPTHALLPGSPAINAGDNCVVLASGSGGCMTTPLTSDQRGLARQVNGTVDIGAFESRGFTISATSGTPQSTPISSLFGLPFVTTVSSAFSEPVDGGAVTFTSPATGASGAFPGNVMTTTDTTNGSGVATSPTFTANGTAGGPYNVVASIGAGLPIADFALTNTRGNQTIAVNTHAPLSAAYNSMFTVAATATSGLVVTNSSAGSCTNIGANFTVTSGTGTCTVKYDQAGDSNYNAAPSVTESVAAQKAVTSTVVTSSINPSDLGQGVTFTATVSSGAGTPAGTVQFTDGSNGLGGAINCVAGGGNTCTAQFSISSLANGNHAIAAIYSGDTNFVGSLGALSGGQVVTSQPALQLILDESGPDANQAAAFDSLLFVRDPFHVQSIAGWLDLGSDRNTRVIIFAANLQLNQGETASAVVVSLVDANSQTFDVPAEDVRLVPNFGFAQVRFRLPNNLAAGACMVTIKAHGQISNTGIIRILSP